MDFFIPFKKENNFEPKPLYLEIEPIEWWVEQEEEKDEDKVIIIEIL